MSYQQVKNYKLGKERIEDFISIKIDQDPEVFFAMPMCLVEYGKEYREPFLVLQREGLPVAIEKVDLLKMLSQLKLYHLKTDPKTGNVVEVLPEEAEISIRLPIDVKLDELEIRDGQIYRIQRTEEVN